MSKIALIGECMVEMCVQKNLYKQKFGGDTFNCSVYLKLYFKKAEVEYITVLGEDNLSKKMLDFFHKEKIRTTYIDKVKDKTPGLYLIDRDNKKRNISYWREDTSAKELFLTRSLNRIGNELMDFDLIYFSAITLAIMSEEGRNNLFRIIKKARAAGVKIAFDSKYRADLFPSSDVARKIYNQAIHYCDIFFSSISDEKELWGEFDTYSIIQKAKEAGCNEIILKATNEEIVYCFEDFTKVLKTKRFKKVVDKTSAGDCFNGAYLASRLKGKDIEKSIKKAKKLVCKVVKYNGAIIAKEKKEVCYV